MNTEGRAVHENGTYRYEYHIKDHLGNIRMTITDKNNNGLIERDTLPQSNEIIDERHYDPFGLELRGPWQRYSTTGAIQRYGYNGKELVEDLDWGVNLFGRRTYRSDLGRFPSVDPLADQRSWLTPYNYVQNNPLNRIDPTGALDTLPSESRVTPLPVKPSPTITPSTTSSAGSILNTAGQRLLGVLGFLLMPANGNIGPNQTTPLNSNIQIYTNDPSTLSDDYMAGVRDRINNGTATPQDYIYEKDAFGRLNNSELNMLPNYVNPGQHDPSGCGEICYNPSKSVLPSNHFDLWKSSVLGSDGNRLTKVSARAYSVYHRFQDDGNGNWHWNVSTIGKTSSGKTRAININNVPIDIKRK